MPRRSTATGCARPAASGLSWTAVTAATALAVVVMGAMFALWSWRTAGLRTATASAPTDSGYVVAAADGARSLMVEPGESLVDVAAGKALAEAPVGARPSGIALTPDGKKVLVTNTFSHDLTLLTRNRRHFSRMPELRLYEA